MYSSINLYASFSSLESGFISSSFGSVFSTIGVVKFNSDWMVSVTILELSSDISLFIKA